MQSTGVTPASANAPELSLEMNLLVMNWLDRENPEAGGAELHLHEAFGRLAERGWGVTLVTSGWPGAPQRARLDRIEVHRVGGRHSYPVLAPRYVRRSLSKQAFDLTVEDLNKAPLFSPIWAPSPCLLIVHHLFGSTGFQGASVAVAAVTWLLEKPLPKVYREVPVVVVSESTRADLIERGFRGDRIQIVENGVDTMRYKPVVEFERFKEATLLYLGRLKRYKRVDLILAAVARLRSQGVYVRLLVAGQGDHRPKLQRQAVDLGLGPEAVEFLGFVSEEKKLELLQRAWVHVLTSAKEGWGISNLEASACATPTVASDSPGLRDSVIDQRTGFLVRHGDADALASKIRLLLSDRTLRSRMGDNAREFALSLSWDRTADRLGSLLEAAVASRHGGD